MNTDPRNDCLAAYDAWAASYDRIDNPLIAQAAAVLQERAAWFGGARVLELGCGTGRNAALGLAAGAARFVGIDGSPGMLAVAKRTIVDPRASFIEADLVPGVQMAGAGGARFDLVLVCLVLEHLPEVGPVTEAAAAVLAPGGRLLILELHAGLHELGVGANFRIGEREIRLPSFRHTAAELTGAVERAGLQALAAAERQPTPTALARSAKLARYRDRPVLVEIAAERPASPSRS